MPYVGEAVKDIEKRAPEAERGNIVGKVDILLTIKGTSLYNLKAIAAHKA